VRPGPTRPTHIVPRPPAPPLRSTSWKLSLIHATVPCIKPRVSELVSKRLGRETRIYQDGRNKISRRLPGHSHPSRTTKREIHGGLPRPFPARATPGNSARGHPSESLLPCFPFQKIPKSAVAHVYIPVGGKNRTRKKAVGSLGRETCGIPSSNSRFSPTNDPSPATATLAQILAGSLRDVGLNAKLVQGTNVLGKAM
jgi:hypothetical protein